MEQSRWLSALVGGPVSLKCENLQRTGLLQDPRRATSGSPGSPPRSARAASSPPRPATTPRASRWPRSCSASSPRCSCPRARRSPRSGRPGRTAPTWSSRATCSRSRWSRRRRFAEETGAVLIHPFDHVDIVAGAGHARSRGARAGARRADRAGADRRRRAARRGRDRDQGARAPTSGSSACRRPAPRRTRTRWRTGRRSQLPSMKTMADGIAVGLPGDIPFAAVRDHVDEIAHRLRGVALPGPAGPGRAGQDGGGARRCRRRRRAAGPPARLHRTRWSRCSPAATSTRCCSAR